MSTEACQQIHITLLHGTRLAEPGKSAPAAAQLNMHNPAIALVIIMLNMTTSNDASNDNVGFLQGHRVRQTYPLQQVILAGHSSWHIWW